MANTKQTFCLIMLCLGIFVLLAFCLYIMVSNFVCFCLCVFLVFFFLLFSFCYFWLCLPACFLKRNEEHRVGWVGKWGRYGRSWGRKNCDQNIQYEIFPMCLETKYIQAYCLPIRDMPSWTFFLSGWPPLTFPLYSIICRLLCLKQLY